MHVWQGQTKLQDKGHERENTRTHTHMIPCSQWCSLREPVNANMLALWTTQRQLVSARGSALMCDLIRMTHWQRRMQSQMWRVCACMCQSSAWLYLIVPAECTHMPYVYRLTRGRRGASQRSTLGLAVIRGYLVLRAQLAPNAILNCQRR